MRRTIPVLLMLLPLPAAADESTRLAPDAWRADFAGRYAVEGRCQDPEAIWVLHPVAVQAGRLNCNGVGKITWADDSATLVVPVTDCQRMADGVPDRTMGFRRAGPDRVLAASGDGLHGGIAGPDAPGTVALRRCDG